MPVEATLTFAERHNLLAPSGRRSIDVEVDVEVQLPAGVEFIGSSVTGDVDVEDVRSDVSASSVSGDVFVSTSEVGRGSTVSGDVRLRRSRRTPPA